MGPVGLLAVVAIFVGFGPLSGNAPGQSASGASVAAFYNAHVAQSWGSIYAVSVGAALLVFFLTHLRTVLRQSGGSDASLLPNAFFFSCIVFLGGLVLAGVDHTVLILASHQHQFAIVKMTNFVDSNNEFGFVIGMALITLTVALAILLNRGGAPLPKTLGWYSLLVAVVSCLGPLSGLAFLFGLPIWVIATGFVVSTKARRGTLGTSGDGGCASVSSAVTQTVAA
jgi:hypothetical protein